MTFLHVNLASFPGLRRKREAWYTLHGCLCACAKNNRIFSVYHIVNARSEYSGERIRRVKTSSLASYFCPVHRQTGAHSTYSSINRDPRKAPFAQVPWTLSTVVISPLIPTFRTGSAASDLPVVVGGSLSQCICRPCNKKFLTEGLRPRKAENYRALERDLYKSDS